MADVTITITIPDAKVAIAAEGFLHIHPVPVDEVTGDPLYTVKQWFKEWLRRRIRDEVARGLSKKAKDLANVESDDGIAT